MPTQSDVPAPPAAKEEPEQIDTQDLLGNQIIPDEINSASEQDLDLLKNELNPALENDLTILDDKKSEEEPEIEMLPAESFKSPLDPVERKHYEKILKSNRETIGSLRKQLQDSIAKNEALMAELETIGKIEE